MEIVLPPDFKEFLKLLNEHDVRYLLIGGMQSVIMAMPAQPKIWTFGLPSTLRTPIRL